MGRGPQCARRRAGLSLVEASTIVCVFGVLLAVAVPTVVRQVRASKTSEATEHLALLYRRSAAYFATPRAGGTHCLPAPAGPTPPKPSTEAQDAVFAESKAGGASWKVLDFEPRYPVRYSYTFEPVSSGCGLTSPPGTFLLSLRAEGDLDGDGARSLVERRAAVRDGELVPQGILYVRDRTE